MHEQVLPADQVLAIQKRFGDETMDARHFVQPNSLMVQQIVGQQNRWTVQELWAWVIENIEYPPGTTQTLDLHSMDAYGQPFQRAYSTIDFWNLPQETLRDRMGDCEDSTFLLASMIRSALPNQEVYASIGFFKDFGHTWVSIPFEGSYLIMDTTLPEFPSAVPIESSDTPYLPIFRVNDKKVIIVEEEFFVPETRYSPGKDRAITAFYAGF